MGTRSIIAFKADKKIKHAQYSQMGGYPMGQGLNLLIGMYNISDSNPEWVAQLRASSLSIKHYTDNEIDALTDDPEWTERYPQLSRDFGSNILLSIYTDPNRWYINANGENLIANSYIEYSYLIDLDENTFSVYYGTLDQYPTHTFPISSLPTIEEWKTLFDINNK